jgi:hypothetical protein
VHRNKHHSSFIWQSLLQTHAMPFAARASIDLHPLAVVLAVAKSPRSWQWVYKLWSRLLITLGWGILGLAGLQAKVRS